MAEPFKTRYTSLKSGSGFVANQIRIKRRAAGGVAGAPSTLKNAELAYNEQDNILYYGYGDDGSGNATSIIGIAGSGNNVTITGAQTVSGDKTFSGTANLTGTFQINSATVTATAAELNITGDVGTFTGSTISDNVTLAAALQELETALEDGSGSLTADDAGTADFASGTVTVSGGTGLSSTASASTLTINLDNTTVSAASYGTTAAKTTSFTVDAQGRLTSASEQDISILHTQVSDFDTGVQANRLDQLAQPTANVAFNNQRITGLADPVGDQDAVTKSYADALVNGLDVKESVRAATTASITLSGTQTVDGIPLIVGDRVLVKDQATGADNGIYVVASGTWSRSEDADNTPGSEVTPGMFVFVEEGSTNADAGFVLTTNGTITLGSTTLDFTQFSGAGQITAGAGLSKIGNTLDVGTADSSRIVVNANDIDLSTHGTAGTYIGLTVDAYGRVSGFSSETTLSGYNIVDAQPLDATLTALAGVTVAADEIIYATAADTFATTSLTSFGRSLVDDVNAVAARATLGLGSMSTQNASSVNITGGTIDGITIDGGTF
jgi:hypothetical protein